MLINYKIFSNFKFDFKFDLEFDFEFDFEFKFEFVFEFESENFPRNPRFLFKNLRFSGF